MSMRRTTKTAMIALASPSQTTKGLYMPDIKSQSAKRVSADRIVRKGRPQCLSASFAQTITTGKDEENSNLTILVADFSRVLQSISAKPCRFCNAEADISNSLTIFYCNSDQLRRILAGKRHLSRPVPAEAQKAPQFEDIRGFPDD